MSDDTTGKTRTITLTGRRPVTIREDEWPVIAIAQDEEYEGEVKCQSFRTSNWSIRVRQHADGRAIVYARYTYDTAWRGEKNRDRKTGEILRPGADIVAAIARVGADLPPDLVAECIADLPAEQL